MEYCLVAKTAKRLLAKMAETIQTEKVAHSLNELSVAGMTGAPGREGECADRAASRQW
jgi:hypothetical protein